jgi:hypothetical protein
MSLSRQADVLHRGYGGFNTRWAKEFVPVRALSATLFTAKSADDSFLTNFMNQLVAILL